MSPKSHRYSRAFRHPFGALRTLRRRFLPSPHVLKSHEVYLAVGSWTFGRAPRRPLTEIFPGIEVHGLELHRIMDRTPGTSIEPIELISLCAMARMVEPRSILEIGTFDGNTALNLAANSPRAEVWTVDLPPGWGDELGLDVPGHMSNVTSLAERGTPQYTGTDLEARIHQIHEDSAALDWAALDTSFDLVYIDGCHHYAYARKDTENALRVLQPNGLIVWHDYGMIHDVSRAVDEFSDRLEIAAVRGQRLAVGRQRTETRLR